MNLNFSDPMVITVVIAVVALLFLAIVVAVMRQRHRRRTENLRTRFGPEYELALREYGSRAKAERALLDRVYRVDRMPLRPLTNEERNGFFDDWETVQARFVDHPRGAVIEADELINMLLKARGYESTSFDQRANDLSVHHSRLVEPFRRANAITVRAGKDEASTEELRTAMLLYRALIEEWLQAPAPITRAEAA
jgi:type II secretory pathway pseudopilin PulG